MRITDLIIKKRNGKSLEDGEIAYIINSLLSGEMADYQISALLMAIWFKGMNTHETAVLTECMAHSGDMADLSSIPGIKVDKHSTGGVGDKTSLIVMPIVSACGAPVAKMSGRGLGHTGGTLDKIESIPGCKTAFCVEDFLKNAKETGISIVGQSGNMAKADKILYAIRDVTGTVDSIPLIVSSIMSKKLAAGADAILLDVKCGDGAFMKNYESAKTLAKAMVDIGTANGKRTEAFITDMDIPLGYAVGNSLEVMEAADVLKGVGPAGLTEFCLKLSAKMLSMSTNEDIESCAIKVRGALENGKAFEKLSAMVKVQGGNEKALTDYSLLPIGKYCREIHSPESGYISQIKAYDVGIAACVLGAGRENKDSIIDLGAGIKLSKHYGDKVEKGDIIARLYSSDENKLSGAEEIFISSLGFSPYEPKKRKSILAEVSKDKCELL